MSVQHTKTVERAYVGRDKLTRVFLRGEPTKPYLTEELLTEGDAVVVRGDRAARPNTIQGAA